MPRFGERSKTRLAACHPDLQRLFNEVVRHYDITILQGYRDKDEQDEAYKNGRSKLKWPMSKHNRHPALAVDVAPYPIDWDNTNRFFYLAGLVEGVAQMMGMRIRWGGDFDSDKDFSNQTFFDGPHYEINV